jgi:hypothetical protein
MPTLGLFNSFIKNGIDRSAWSLPIKSPDGKVLGTFGTYYRTHRSPTPQECKGVELLAAAAAFALAKR